MLKVKLTENYTGVTISGDYDDLDYLYDSIHYFIKEEEESIGDYCLKNHIYAFLYDLRHAYQGDREYELVDNSLNKDKKEWLDIEENDVTENNFYLSFNYVITDIILDMMIMKHYIACMNKKENNIYNPYINMVNYFYSLVLHSLKGILTQIQFNKVQKGLINSVIYDDIYLPQWFEMITLDYLKMTKKQRQREIMHILDEIYNYIKYEDYLEMKKEIEKTCEERKCNLSELHYDEYSEPIEW